MARKLALEETYSSFASSQIKMAIGHQLAVRRIFVCSNFGRCYVKWLFLPRRLDTLIYVDILWMNNRYGRFSKSKEILPFANTELRKFYSRKYIFI